ncbi:MAG TPA: 4'-phosphopantetheinyl transferase superfamily protein [Streptomyces sp.]|nr:4'-phosphopantetheinyl transferase superfamily protein [Streptomyces sp.]
MAAEAGPKSSAARPTPPPPGDTVHVWHGRLPTRPQAVAPEALALLSAEERARIAGAADPAAGSRYAAVRLAVREVLHGYLGVAPGRIRFAPTPCCRCGSERHGRPRIAWPPTALHLSVSRSGPHWLLAVAAGGPVGVDVERHRAVDVARMAPACLTASERSQMAGADEPVRTRAFFRCWTRKEAVLKGCGVGLAADLAALDVHPREHPVARVAQSACSCAREWVVQDLTCGPECSAALARPAECAGPVLLRAFP